MSDVGAPTGGGPFDIEGLRGETPGCLERVHLNNAGTGLMPTPVIEAAKSHWSLEASIGGYEAADAKRAEVAAAYQTVADLLGADASNVAFMENATAAFNQALSAVPFNPGDVLLTSANDYVSNQIAYLSLASRFGVEVLRAPDSPEGGVDPVAMEELIHRRRPRLVALTHVPTRLGSGATCRGRGPRVQRSRRPVPR